MTRRTIALAVIALIGGCAPPKVQPDRTLREMYELQAEVEKTADPYDLGTGAAPGRVNHDRAGGTGPDLR